MISINKTLLIAAIGLLPFSYLKLFGNFSISDLFFSLSFFCFICYTINKRTSVKEIVVNNDFIIPLFIFSIGFFLSAHNAFDVVDSILAYLQIIFIFIVIYYSMIFHDHTDGFLRRILFFLTFMSISITTFLLLFFLTGVDYSYGFLSLEKGWGMTRFSYGDMEPNITARIMAQSIPIALLLYIHKKNFLHKIISILSILLLLSIIILTASRTGLVVVLIGVFFYILFYYRYKSSYNIFSVVIYSLILICLFTFVYQSSPLFFENALERYSTIFDSSYSSSSQERIFILEESLALINRYPFIGYGFGNSHNITGVSVHNSIIISWIENGFFGLIGYTMIYLIILYYIIIGYLNRFFNSSTLMILAVISIMMITGDMFMANSYKRSLWVPVIMFIIYHRQLYKLSINR